MIRKNSKCLTDLNNEFQCRTRNHDNYYYCVYNVFFLPMILCRLDPPTHAVITPPMTTTVGAVFKCAANDGKPPIDRYEWKYETERNGPIVSTQLNGSSDTWALTGEVLYGQ